MRLLSVLPLARAFGAETLSYYATNAVVVGAIVKIPLRKKVIPGLVVESKEIKDVRSEIRGARFSTKKIDSVITDSFFLPEHIRAAELSALLHATRTGNVLSALAPKAILEKAGTYTKIKQTEKTVSKETKPQAKIFQAVPHERFSRYKSMVRESFARGVSVFVLVPSVAQGETLFDTLSKGIEDRTFFLSHGLSTKTLRGSWMAALESKTPVVVIGTPSFLSIPRRDIGLYIIEEESSSYYKLRGRPHLDVRVIAEHIAKEMHAECIFGATALSLETIHRFDEHELEDVVRSGMKYNFESAMTIVDARTKRDDEGRPLQILAEEILAVLGKAVTEGRRSFIYAVRQGFAPLTICKDCGKTLVCDRCDAPMVLHQRGSGDSLERIFSCHRCGRVRSSRTVCDNCQSWRLEPLGLGIERVSAAILHALPQASLFEIHSGVADIDTKEHDIVERWKASKNGILIGTERALSHLARYQADVSIVASVDSLIALPDFRMSEKIFSLLVDIRLNTRAHILVQTRTPDYPIFGFVMNGDGSAFYRHEKSLRESYGYPPFTVPIKITRSGNRETITKDLELLAEKVAPRDTAVYPAFIGTVRNQSVAHLLITVPHRVWPDTELLKLVAHLSPAYDVDVMPRSFL